MKRAFIANYRDHAHRIEIEFRLNCIDHNVIKKMS